MCINVTKLWLPAILLILLAGCGGDSPTDSRSPAERLTGSRSSSGSTNDGDDPVDRVMRIGSGTGENFTQGALSVSNTELSAGDSITVTATIVDGSNAAVSRDVWVSFSSNCSADGMASFSESRVLTVAGRASVVYTAEGCSGTDVVTASASNLWSGDAMMRASAEVFVQSDEVLSVQYVEAANNQLALSGMGGEETTRLTFRLVGAQGAAIRNESVSFSLNTTVGGVRLADGRDSATSDSSGMVTTVLQSGTVSTNVRVTATHDATGRSGVSENITISTGVPVSSHFSVSVSQYNPAGAYATDGIELDIGVIASDQYGNDALDGTQISFWSPESGNIDSSCTLVSGQCAVKWRSSEPRPLDGRLTIIAYTSGAEDFRDTNGNNVFDAGDQAVWASGANDLPEPCIDEDENGVCEVGEFFVDSNENGSLDVGDNEWNGPCLSGVDDSAICPSEDSILVSRTQTVVMPTHFARLIELGDFPQPGGTIRVAPPVTSLSGLMIADDNASADSLGSNPMPGGTAISFSVDGGELMGTSSWTVPGNTTAPTGPYGVTLKARPSGQVGMLTLKTSVGSDVTEYSWFIEYL